MTNKCDITHYAWQELTSEDKKYAAIHLNETNETRKNAIAEIKRWIKENDNLPEQIDNFLILQFLRVDKFDLEKTKYRIRNYYKHRSNVPEWYSSKDPFQRELQVILNLGIFLPLRKQDSQGRTVYLVRADRNDPRIHKISNLAKICAMALDASMKYNVAGSVYGYTWYVDVSNVTTGHIFQLTPSTLKNLVDTWQKCYPLRYQKIVLFNVPTIFYIVVRILRSFMTQKLKNRFYVYSHQNCFEEIPTDGLPVEYGGTGETIQELTEFWKKFIEDNRDWLTKDENNQTIQTTESTEDF